ncbi:MAG: DNA polymerase III subunit delta [Treponema sp.]|jgi:DNA polymerase-3 subunit delta|nr:DNA polymerase III subunit delta [Treponema sp.]
MVNPCSIFLGPEIGEKQEAVEEIRKQLTAKHGDFERIVFYAGETPVSRIMDVLRNGSLFVETRLIIIKNAEAFKAESAKKKEDLDALAGFMSNPQKGTYLILLSDEIRIAEKLDRAVPKEAKKIFWEMFENRKRDWIVSFFRREGFRISAEGIQTILELVENNTGALKQECSRLTLFLDKNRELGSEEIEKWLSHSREESVFTLFSRIAAGDLSRSLESIRSLLASKENPRSLLAGMAGRFRTLRSYLLLTEAGVTSEEEFRNIGLKSQLAKKDFQEAGRRYTSGAVDTCLSLTAGYDSLILQNPSFPDHILLDEYIYKIYRAGQSGGADGGAPIPTKLQ